MKRAIAGLVGCLLFGTSLWGAPPHPKLIEELKEREEFDRFWQHYKSLGNYDQPNTSNPYRFTLAPRMAAGAAPPETMKVVVIYATPSDRPWNHGPDGVHVTGAQLDSILFGNNPNGNISDYYAEISYGQTVVIGDVYGPFVLPNNNAFYTTLQGNNGIPATNFTNHALAAADPTVNFSQYDADNDGWVDGLFIVHSGPGAEETNNPADIWSHASGVNPHQRDGKWISSYSIQPEQQRFPVGPIEIGVFCHEAGHSLFGLPDLYDTDGSTQGIGAWCLMASGNYQNNSRTPVHMSAWCKKEVGWVNPVRLTANQNNVSIPAAEYNPVSYRLYMDGILTSQYFLVENRRLKGFDSFLPGQGLLIWHIDDAGAQANELRPRVALEQADGLNQMHTTGSGNRGDVGDPFPGSSNNRNFDQFSNPSSNHNSTGFPTKVAVFNLSNSDSVMTADMEITYGRPRVTGFTASVNDATGNGNGRPDPGEMVDMYLSFTNAWLATSGWNAVMRIKDTLVTVSDSTLAIGSLPGNGASTSSSPDGIRFSVPFNFGRSRFDSIFVSGWNSDSSHTFSGAARIQVGPTQIVLVDDDHNRTLENYYRTPIQDTLLLPLRHWPVATKGVPPQDSLAAFPHLFWFTGNDSTSLLNSARIAALSAYMNAGGNVVLSGQGIAQTLASGADSAFLRNYFHCRYRASQSPAVYGVGAPGNPVTGNLNLILIGGGGAGNQTQEDQLDFIDGRVNKIFTYHNLNILDTTGPLAAVAYADSNYRAIFCGFGLEAVNSQTVVQGGARRSQVFSKILDWLESPALTGFSMPYISLDRSSLNFSAANGGAAPPAESLFIENSGGGSLNWTAAESPAAGWLSLSSSGGTAPSFLHVNIDSTNLVPGSYADTIVIAGPGAFNTPRKVTVSYTVAAGRGDLDQNGLIQLADIQLLTNCTFLGTGSCGLALADINCDGILTSVDVVLLINIHFFSLSLPC